MGLIVEDVYAITEKQMYQDISEIQKFVENRKIRLNGYKVERIYMINCFSVAPSSSISQASSQPWPYLSLSKLKSH